MGQPEHWITRSDSDQRVMLEWSLYQPPNFLGSLKWIVGERTIWYKDLTTTFYNMALQPNTALVLLPTLFFFSPLKTDLC